MYEFPSVKCGSDRQRWDLLWDCLTARHFPAAPLIDTFAPTLSLTPSSEEDSGVSSLWPLLAAAAAVRGRFGCEDIGMTIRVKDGELTNLGNLVLTGIDLGSRELLMCFAARGHLYLFLSVMDLAPIECENGYNS